MQLLNSSGTEGEEEVGVVEAVGVLGMFELVGVVDSVEVVAGIVVAPPFTSCRTVLMRCMHVHLAMVCSLFSSLPYTFAIFKYQFAVHYGF